VLTATDAERDKVAAFELGADDYVTKPFGMAELLARIKVALRHGEQAKDTLARPHVVEAGDLRVDLDAKLVTKAGEPVHLTRIEWGPVEVLAANAGRLCTHRFLLSACGDPATSGNPSTCGSTWPTCARSSTTRRRPRSS
jgi:two-component system KDP operon response regulator KdpE